MSAVMEPVFPTVGEAAGVLRMSRTRIFDRIRTNRLRSRKFGRVRRPSHGHPRVREGPRGSPMTDGSARRKRANGEGTIYPRKDGRFEGAAYVLMTDGTVRRQRVYGRTRRDAFDKLAKIQQLSREGIPMPSESWTVERFLSYWLEHVVKPNSKPKTYEGYKAASPRDASAATDPRRAPERAPERVQGRDHHANVARLVSVPAPNCRVHRGVDVEQARRLIDESEGDRFHALDPLPRDAPRRAARAGPGERRP